MTAQAQSAGEPDGAFRARVSWRASFGDSLYALRDRLLESPRFQRLSAKFPLTRPVAHRQARALFDVCAGFVYSQVLFACVELDIFSRLRAQPKRLDQLSHELEIPAERLARLLEAAVSLRLLSRRGDRRYGLGMLGAALVGNPGIRDMIRHHAMLYRDLQDPVALLRDPDRQNELATFWGYAGSNSSAALGAEDVRPYSELMASSQSFIADDVLDAYPFQQHACLMDVGGGEGAFIATAAAKYPALKFKLFDLPAVAARAQSRMAAAGLSSRVTLHGGSFVEEPLPRGADVISLVRVLHDHDDPTAAALLRAAYEALPTGGRLLIAEPMAGVVGAGHVASAYFGFYLLAMGSGRARTLEEIDGMLTAAGFKSLKRLRTRQPMLVSAAVAEK